MSATRSRREDKVYKAYLKSKSGGCNFCQIKSGDDQFINETKSFKVIRNIFAYSVWDGQKVTDHLMVVPKKHSEGLNSLSPSQSIEFLKLISGYEKKGYNIYARAPDSLIKSIPHQHTHLIKTDGPPVKVLFLARKPFYFRIPR